MNLKWFLMLEVQRVCMAPETVKKYIGLTSLGRWSCRKAGRVAEEAEKDKVDKYKPMSNEFYMVPICVETLGVWGPAGYKFIKELGRMTCEKTVEKRSTSFIMQSISIR